MQLVPIRTKAVNSMVRGTRYNIMVTFVSYFAAVKFWS